MEKAKKMSELPRTELISMFVQELSGSDYEKELIELLTNLAYDGICEKQAIMEQSHGNVINRLRRGFEGNDFVEEQYSWDTLLDYALEDEGKEDEDLERLYGILKDPDKHLKTVKAYKGIGMADDYVLSLIYRASKYTAEEFFGGDD